MSEGIKSLLDELHFSELYKILIENSYDDLELLVALDSGGWSEFRDTTKITGGKLEKLKRGVKKLKTGNNAHQPTNTQASIIQASIVQPNNAQPDNAQPSNTQPSSIQSNNSRPQQPNDPYGPIELNHAQKAKVVKDAKPEDFKCLKSLGKGSGGEVFEVSVGKVRVALKIIDLKKINTGLQELELWKQIPPHPRVAPLYHHHEQANSLYMYTEMYDNGSLYNNLRLMKNSDPGVTMSPGRQVDYALQIAEGLAHLHKNSITHRDLAARNILLSSKFEAVVSDFGLARSGDYYRLLSPDLVLPLMWIAPEAFASKKFSSTTDVWSYGVLLWELATWCQAPPDGISTNPAAFLKGLDTPLLPIIKSCLSLVPSERPPMVEIVQRLHQLKAELGANSKASKLTATGAINCGLIQAQTCVDRELTSAGKSWEDGLLLERARAYLAQRIELRARTPSHPWVTKLLPESVPHTVVESLKPVKLPAHPTRLVYAWYNERVGILNTKSSEPQVAIRTKCSGHPNVVSLFAVVTKNYKYHGMLLEYLERGNLENRQPYAMLPREAVAIALGITRGLAHVHAQGIVHNDVVPRNVVLDVNRAALTGFELSRVMDKGRYVMTDERVLLPWARFSPEVTTEALQGKPPTFTEKTDVWALGLMLWELCTTQPVYKSMRQEEVQKGLVAGTLRLDLSPIALNYPELLPAIIACLQFNPGERATAAEVAILLGDTQEAAERAITTFQQQFEDELF